ncbi:MAG: ABC transporter, partial [Azonexus sp.]|nr:ABC transporter [Azonexus sp.]
MTPNAHNTASNELALPSHWAAEVEPLLAAPEMLQAYLEIDLDSRLQFTNGLVLLTNQRLLAKAPGANNWQQWPLRAGLTLNHFDHAGVGMLELTDDKGRVATWRYTLSRNLAALRVISEFELHRDSQVSGQPLLRSTADSCPKCKAPLPPGEDECPICSHETSTPPSTWTLFRLARFARPYKWQLISGFLLTLASTGATLVPP